jgi:hypothetical protein
MATATKTPPSEHFLGVNYGTLGDNLPPLRRCSASATAASSWPWRRPGGRRPATWTSSAPTCGTRPRTTKANLASGAGTPRRPGTRIMPAMVFAPFDENLKWGARHGAALGPLPPQRTAARCTRWTSRVLE